MANKILRVAGYSVLIIGIVGILAVIVLSFATIKPSYEAFEYPNYYTNNAEINKKALQQFAKPMVREAAKNFFIKEAPVHKVSYSKMDIAIIIDSEQLSNKVEDALVPNLASYMSKDQEKFLEVRSGANEKFVLYANKGISSGNQVCGKVVPTFMSVLFPSIEFTVEEYPTGTSSCELSIYQVIDTIKVVSFELAPQCQVSVVEGKVTRLECATAFVKSSENLRYILQDPITSMDELTTEKKDYALVSDHDIDCDGEGCDNVSTVGLNVIPKNMKYVSSDLVYVVFQQSGNQFAVPHHRIILSGTLSQPIPRSNPNIVPTTYTIIYPSIEFRHFKK
jgi:hypothetical protein